MGCSLPAEGTARKKPQGRDELAFSENSKEARVAQGNGRGKKDLFGGPVGRGHTRLFSLGNPEGILIRGAIHSH